MGIPTTQWPLVETLAETDDILINASAKTRRTKFSVILNAIKSKLPNWEYSSLETKEKTLPGAINELREDTGWINIIGTSIANADLVAPSVGTPVRYRKKGGVVYINGTFGLKNKVANTNKILFTLPDGYRMSSGFYYFTNTSSGYVMSRYILSSNGQVNLEWVRKFTDGSEMTGNIVWAGIDTCFPVG